MIRYNEPTICLAGKSKAYSGYIDIEKNKHIFFWFFEAQTKETGAPIIVWLNGGPGDSSLISLFMEHGPCKYEGASNHLVENPYAWNKEAHIIYIDQPTNVGFSYGDSVCTKSDVGNDVYKFLTLFFQHFKEYKNNTVHIFGEGYAGHYVAATAVAINRGNKIIEQRVNDNNNSTALNGLLNNATQTNNYISLNSIGIGNGLVDPAQNYAYIKRMACNPQHKTANSTLCDHLQFHTVGCVNKINECNLGLERQQSPEIDPCTHAQVACNNDLVLPLISAKINIADFRNLCEYDCYPEKNRVQLFLNNKETQAAIGVSDFSYKTFNQQVLNCFRDTGDWMQNSTHLIPELLNNDIRVLIYSGDTDILFNWMGARMWTDTLTWKYAAEYKKEKEKRWKSVKIPSTRYRESGLLKQYKNLAFLRMYDAGEMAARDQPENLQNMITSWVKFEPFDTCFDGICSLSIKSGVSLQLIIICLISSCILL
ncbi:Carboxypeptidase Y [Zancudomyces culisetae]|uniref:carboxypeptidase C n=1 Tax=Zancudomyces culisetae TaxID=1213189 RepID=A0A1R1PF43_ZANCU|nr:Carboxypeptidase Y [Zancudomyces culisetae]|eukprot:OMH79523.1 Carboxypeptidase Y [Zancudomyces culisetae]